MLSRSIWPSRFQTQIPARTWARSAHRSHCASNFTLRQVKQLSTPLPWLPFQQPVPLLASPQALQCRRGYACPVSSSCPLGTSGWHTHAADYAVESLEPCCLFRVLRDGRHIALASIASGLLLCSTSSGDALGLAPSSPGGWVGAGAAWERRNGAVFNSRWPDKVTTGGGGLLRAVLLRESYLACAVFSLLCLVEQAHVCALYAGPGSAHAACHMPAHSAAAAG